MNFSYSQVLEFKRILDEKFGVYLHFHDACCEFSERIGKTVKSR